MFGLSLLLPFILWLIDGYSVAAQILNSDDVNFSCTTESIFSQLSRLNYGIWHILIIVPIISTITSLIIKVKKH